MDTGSVIGIIVVLIVWGLIFALFIVGLARRNKEIRLQQKLGELEKKFEEEHPRYEMFRKKLEFLSADLIDTSELMAEIDYLTEKIKYFNDDSFIYAMHMDRIHRLRAEYEQYSKGNDEVYLKEHELFDLYWDDIMKEFADTPTLLDELRGVRYTVDMIARMAICEGEE